MGQLSELLKKYGPELKEKVRDPVFFVREVIFKPRGWHLPEYGEEWLQLCQKHKRTNFLAFRTSGKTEILLVCQAIHRAFCKRGFEGIIISNSLQQSVDVMRRIRDTVLENELLRTAVPSNKSSSWSKTEVEFKNKSLIRCKPYNENVRGLQVDWVGMDETGTYRDHDILKYAITPIVMAKNGDINGIGTPMSKIDLPHKLRENKAWLSKIYPAWTSKVNLYKQRYPDRVIKKGRGKYRIYDAKGRLIDEYDSITWSREFMCLPLGEEDKLFPFELVEQAFDYNMSLFRKRSGDYDYFIGADFALSAEASADYTVIIVLARNKKTGKMYLVDMYRWKGLSYGAQRKKLAEILKYYRPVKAVLDESSFGASFLDDMRRECFGISIEGFKFSVGPYTNKKQELITMLRTTFESNWESYKEGEKTPLPDDKKNFLIPREKSDTRTMKITTELVEELMSFGMKYDEKKHTVKFEGIGTHDDIVIALALANYGCHGNIGLKPIVNRGSVGYLKASFGKTH